MRTARDQLAKRIAKLLLEPQGKVTTEEEVSVEPQRIDTWFVPDPERVGVGTSLLHRMAQQACMLESFFSTPTVQAMRACIRKQLVWDHALKPRNHRARARRPPCLWFICAGRPSSAMAGLGFVPRSGWPSGTYALPPSWNIFLTVANELPDGRDTLMVRLMGSGKVLENAIREVLALPPDAPERAILPEVATMHVEVRKGKMAKRSTTADLEDFLVATQPVLEEIERQQRERGRKQGLKQGIKQGLTRAAEALQQDLKAVYAKRFGACPSPVVEAIEAIDEFERLSRLTLVFATGTQQQIARALRSE